MSPKEQAQHLSDALQKSIDRRNVLEHELFTTNNNREELKRLNRVIKALSRDLTKLVRTIPAPLQYGLPGFTEVDAPRAAPTEFDQKTLSSDERWDASRYGVEEGSTLSGRVS